MPVACESPNPWSCCVAVDAKPPAVVISSVACFMQAHDKFLRVGGEVSVNYEPFYGCSMILILIS